MTVRFTIKGTQEPLPLALLPAPLVPPPPAGELTTSVTYCSFEADGESSLVYALCICFSE